MPSHRSSGVASECAMRADWWSLTVSALWPRISSFAQAAQRDPSTNLEAIGETWNEAALARYPQLPSARDTDLLLEQIRAGIGALHAGVSAPPTLDDLRICRRGQNVELVLDINMHMFIFPIVIGTYGTWANGRRECGCPAAGVVELVRFACRERVKLTLRHVRMRVAVNGVVAGIGCGATPLWCRMRAVPYDSFPDCLEIEGYEVSIVLLSSTLDRQPVGVAHVDSDARIRKLRKKYAQQQAFRNNRLDTLTAAGAIGMIDPVAFAAITLHQQDPVNILKHAIDAGRKLSDGGLALYRGAHRETLFYQDGVLRVDFTFGPFARGEGSGHFDGQRRTILGCYPETLANGVQGQPLGRFVDHPLLIASDVRVSSIKRTDDAICLSRANGGTLILETGEMLEGYRFRKVSQRRKQSHRNTNPGGNYHVQL